ncbi:MAG TPA: condensation domain-containing protein, partial [Acidimicrobiales bacterium]|nr:condensation domain-containing protein [Acidimicrobiales bacterium]
MAQTRDPLALAQLIEGSSANLCQATPATWQMLVESGWKGHPGLRVVCGGEAFGASLVNSLTERAAEVWNFYGPTETTVWSVFTRLEAGTIDPVPMGLPLANTSCFVLDQWQEPVPIGVIGELFIGGAGVARGYLGRPDLTAEKFVTNSFGGDAGSRLYRTGDLVRWRSDGQLVFIGRTDHQVKLRGFRIELGEVESVLGDISGIAHAVAIVREDVPGNRLLVAYIVPSGDSVDTKEVEEELRRRLPAYMVPSTIVPLAELPLTPNGKLDRAALPQPTADLVSVGEYVAPSTPTEQALAGVWGALVGSERLSATDNFFDLGGHSLQATRLVSRIAESMNVVVPLETIFEQPVLWRFAAAVDQLLASQRSGSPLPRVEHADRSRHQIRSEALSHDPGRVQVVAYGGPGSDEDGELLVFPASYAQERMWVLEQLEPGRALYNVPVARRIVGEVDIEALQAALNNLVARHEVLRTSLTDIDGIVTQVVHPNVDVPLVEFGAAATDDPWSVALATTVAEALRPFDLARAPLARATLVKAGPPEGTPDPDDDPSDRQWVFCLTVHHGVIDGSSIELLMDELRTDYEALAGGHDIPPHATAPIDYGDYVLWQRASAMRDRETADLAFWRHNLEGAVTALDFPFDNLRPAVQSHRGGRCFRRVDPVVAAGLRESATELSATLFMVVLAGWTALLARYCQQDEIIIGTPISGRQPAELESVVGLLVNTLPLRVSLGDDPTFAQLVRRTRSVLLAGMDHQSAPFERIVDAVHAGHDLSRHPVFQVMATMQPDQPAREPFGHAEMSSLPIDWGWSRFTDMSLVVMEHDGAIDLGLEYSADLLDSATAERLLGHLEGLLRAGIAEPGAPTSQLVFNREEHHKLLVEWNATSQPYPSGKCIHQLIAERTVEAPHAVAVEFGDGRLTYAELDARANQLAHKLRELGVDRDVI